uniref:Endonuclease/exonuclease/phosphatase domain-containing protein n=1 Tax=Trichogramma kaykai TaxID=54128 RepID=A0ABD2WZ34_9HYME
MFGSGVACYVRDDLPTKIVYHPKITHVDENEVLSVAVAFAKRKILLNSVYRHPKGNYCNPLFEHFQSICYNYDHHIFVGDFNANMLSTSNMPTACAHECSLELITCVGLSGPTHHTNFTGTWIDLAFVDSMLQVHSYVKSIVPFNRGYDFFYLDYIIGAPAAVARPRLSRNLLNVNKTLFVSQLDACLSTFSSPLSSYDDTNLMLEEFNARVLGVLDDHAPHRLTQRRRVSAP